MVTTRRRSDEERKRKNRERQRQYRARHREKTNAARRAAYAATNEWERRRPYYFKKRYGISEEERDALFASQGEVCPICETDDPKSKVGWVVDHCHTSGKIRGVLCHQCNTMLGMARDNTDTLSKAIAYLKAN